MKKRMHIFSLRNKGIRYKLFLSYVLVILIPFLLLLFINIHATRGESKETGLQMARKMLEETNSYLQYKAQAITEVLNFVAFNKLVQQSVDTDSQFYEDVNEWHMDALRLYAIVNQFRYNEDIDFMQLYMKQGLAAATENTDFLNMGKVETERWFIRFAQSNAAFTWLPDKTVEMGEDSGDLVVLRKIPSVHNIQQFNGMVKAQVKKSGIQSVLNHAVLTPNASVLLFNSSGDVLSTSTKVPFTSAQIAQITRHFKSDDINYWNDSYLLNNQRYLFGVQDIAHTDMKIAMLVPYSDILESSKRATTRIIWIFLFVVPLMLPVSYLVTKRATKRILKLITHMRKMKNGNFQFSLLPVSEDEVGELMRNFNDMATNITNLMDETYLLGREVKNKELQALQAQINPHFLYNSLDLINIMAIEAGRKDISEVVEELALFYKLSLSNGKEYVTLENELKHTEAYVSIQNMRFGGGIRLDIEVPVDLYDCQVPKILLQPLVENGILHGIREGETEEGTIRISASVQDGDLVLEVSDDGIGMDEEQLSHIFTRPHSSKGGGYGVHNIQERLKLAYGPSYGLDFRSAPGMGTTVTLKLPCHKKT
ncbi:sensor histidine kinase [Paenibacillus puldeungensis]|uniref:histidine kinase n=1 Tax=Paenibacillus puldeungensis TaxID=696536 RepID=A0ABW3S517_9BACL